MQWCVMHRKPVGYLIQADVSFFQLSEARHLHDEDVSSFRAQQQQLPQRVGQHRRHSGHVGKGTEAERERRNGEHR